MVHTAQTWYICHLYSIHGTCIMNLRFIFVYIFWKVILNKDQTCLVETLKFKILTERLDKNIEFYYAYFILNHIRHCIPIYDEIFSSLTSVWHQLSDEFELPAFDDVSSTHNTFHILLSSSFTCVFILLFYKKGDNSQYFILINVLKSRNRNNECMYT